MHVISRSLSLYTAHHFGGGIHSTYFYRPLRFLKDIAAPSPAPIIQGMVVDVVYTLKTQMISMGFSFYRFSLFCAARALVFVFATKSL